MASGSAFDLPASCWPAAWSLDNTPLSANPPPDWILDAHVLGFGFAASCCWSCFLLLFCFWGFGAYTRQLLSALWVTTNSPLGSHATPWT